MIQILNLKVLADETKCKKKKKKKKKIENCTILIPKGNSYCRCKSSAEDLSLKSHPKEYQQKLTPIYVPTKADVA